MCCYIKILSHSLYVFYKEDNVCAICTQISAIFAATYAHSKRPLTLYVSNQNSGKYFHIPEYKIQNTLNQGWNSTLRIQYDDA